MTNELEIRTLTTRFFNGETSLDEERRLYELYQSAEELPADLLELREMMLDLGILSKQKPTQQRIAQKPTLNPSPRVGVWTLFLTISQSPRLFKPPSLGEGLGVGSSLSLPRCCFSLVLARHGTTNTSGRMSVWPTSMANASPIATW